MAGQKQQIAKRNTGAVPIGLKKRGARPSTGGKTSRKSIGTPKASKRKNAAAQGWCLPSKIGAESTIPLQQDVFLNNCADMSCDRRRCHAQGAPLQTRHRRSPRNPSLPALNRPATSETPILPPREFSKSPLRRVTASLTQILGSRNRSVPPPCRRRLPALAKPSHTSAPRSR